ncbi:hypothetical protein KL86DES1_20236 [uncultured Desulfovibrio sp.]|uniref:Uncharacterized protein n=1 Tax=uncultured Desulfovibrio sp. TaxID=167968 RepID=A0A212L2S8_9BACT|nr:hypothetical protein KL86DES1_20236 [uncultured Desulfovibrio sp.]VZH33137.1 conserved protein of unknown function [Desulfovibrio sp. 86]
MGIYIHKRDAMPVTSFTCVSKEQNCFQEDMQANVAAAPTLR